ncbi:MAG: UvrD-helicase domain-containing protein [Bacteroidetes bacterium]|nr:UvrD-helicase domain-containing protein [Bacteroidota bacterium]
MAQHSTSLADSKSRNRALTDIDVSLVVEAGAGTGKTTILAGRIAVMLAHGKPPEHIVAVTFTEAAASELLLRVREYVHQLRSGKFPPGLKDAFGGILSPESLHNLDCAEKNLDTLTCSTIHGFCQRVLKTFPVEANIDPGAVVMDEMQANGVFHEVMHGWLRTILSKEDGYLVAQLLFRNNLNYLQDITNCLRSHRSATVKPPNQLGETLTNFKGTLKEYIDVLKDLQAEVPSANDITDIFTHWIEIPLINTESHACDVIAFIDFPFENKLVVNNSSRTQMKAYSGLSKQADWLEALDGTKVSIKKAHKRASDAYNKVRTLWNDKARHQLSDLLLAKLMVDLNGLFERYQQYKRSAGLLDFEDLIIGVVTLVRHPKYGQDVRQALAQQYKYILVDEFQDTDAQQAEIFWNLSSDDNHHDWTKLKPRAGSLFIVGDPNQSIYRFRGANVEIYSKARQTFPRDNVLKIVTNFRSTAPVLDFINDRFMKPLSQSDQAGYTPLKPFIQNTSDSQSVATIPFDAEEASASKLHETEAVAVAQICQQLINTQYRAKDIALLTPTGTDIHYYERALQHLGIQFETQAGKNFFLLQEIQDLVALTQILADGSNSLALGAFLRGPLIGCTDQEILDLAWELPRNPDRPDDTPYLNAWIDVNHIKNEMIYDVINKLQSLLKIANRCTPYLLLASAVDCFHIRAHLNLRYGKQAHRALSNVDLFLEKARAYNVRGLRDFASSIYQKWDSQTPTPEAKSDISQDAITISTMHNAKGLEWPVVIPINTWKEPRRIDNILVDRSTEQLYATLFSIPSSGIQQIKASETEQQQHERTRLWYVATTRARNLLLLTAPITSPPKVDKSWRGIVDLHIDDLPIFTSKNSSHPKAGADLNHVQVQSYEDFMKEGHQIKHVSNRLKWISPSKDEVPSIDLDTTIIDEDNRSIESIDPSDIQGKGIIRGLVIHRLIEEILTGETTRDHLLSRAEQLTDQIHASFEIEAPDQINFEETCRRILHALDLPQIRPLLDSLVPECPVYNYITDTESESAITGIADAISFSSDGEPLLIIDWKSGQVDPHHRKQIGAYMNATGIRKGLLVYIDSGQITEVHLDA